MDYYKSEDIMATIIEKKIPGRLSVDIIHALDKAMKDDIIHTHLMTYKREFSGIED